MSAQVIQFQSDRTPKMREPDSKAKVVRVDGKRARQRNRPITPPSQQTQARVERRSEHLEDLFEWIRQGALCMVRDWYELFAVGRKASVLRAVSLTERDQFDFDAMTDQEVIEAAATFDRAVAASGLAAKFASRVSRAELVRDDLYFWDRCTVIYAEEMQEAERIAAAARERVAQRIEQEFGSEAVDIPDALRENDPQGYALEWDWS